ncbi:MAG: anhydro-N-acetylmuramic acid kinase [Campylobacterales bacterium]|nr:anhydro-N-acetylmuramic acid kinase [Campylobacterales bacterium]
MSEYYIGVMSGTSMDGIDIALCLIDESSCKLEAYEEYPFPSTLKEKLLAVIETGSTLQTIGTLHTQLGKLFGDKITQFLHAHKINPANIKAIGLHGQTLWHEPNAQDAFSMQLGDANRVVAQTNITTITDFRNADIAHGGEGAPFAPAFHNFLFHKQERKVGVLNIGGMANISILGENLRGWDTGCGNVLLDMWIHKTHNKAFDENGDLARSGKVDEALLQKMMQDEYFTKLPPKSTGREYFNASWLESKLPLFHTTSDADMQRTLLELTAQSIAKDVNKEKLQELILCGGGAKNIFLLERLSALCSANIVTSDEYDVPSQAIEAMAFAWFAYKRIHNEVVELSSVTGAKKNSLLGAIYG